MSATSLGGGLMDPLLTPEWIGQYISYEEMKEILNNVVSEIPTMNDINRYLTREQYFRLADKYFFQVNYSF